MLHTDDDFLRAIEAQPADRTVRLVYADWLDEHARPADAELIRVEEEMRALPVFADRFWELKPRRNELRALAGPEWCGRMRYGTECEPVFRHGIPDGWRERWRLIREFTERWHRVPMGDVGGRQKEIAEAEARLGRTLPPSVREWIAFIADWGVRPVWHSNIAEDYFSLCEQHQCLVVLRQDDWSLQGVSLDELDEADPHVALFEPLDWESGAEWVSKGLESATLSQFAFERAVPGLGTAGSFSVFIWRTKWLREELIEACSSHARLDHLEVFEVKNFVVTLTGGTQLRVAAYAPTTWEQVPAFLLEYARTARNPQLGGTVSGVFAA